IEFDFITHELEARTSDGARVVVPLRPVSVAEFYDEVSAVLRSLGVDVRIRTMPSEIEDAVPFEQDHVHASYDAAYANRFWRVVAQSARVLTDFRARFIGKVSPVHFFWGSFDIAVTRFSGRPAPPHPGGVPNLPDWVAREAYSHEVSSAGWWPGNGPLGEPAFYSYAYPAAGGFAEYAVRPAAAFFSKDLGEFVLPYEAVRQADDPDATLLEFLQTTYNAAADLGRWDRGALEGTLPPPTADSRVQRPIERTSS
ncbi:MAG: DUF5996 family protein, partial [Longimicrobiales bacterium]